MTIYTTLISRGYLPKELPPTFASEDFSRYAASKPGRAALLAYKPSDKFTELVSYRLALPGHGGLHTRQLQIPHPWAFAVVARLVAKNFRRLLHKAGASKFSKSRPVYTPGDERALRTLIKPSNLARERSLIRAGTTHLLKVDVSQFYPSLYTHAIGWAIDPKLRHRRNWSNTKLLGKQIDQSLMNMQGKVSQGIAIGNDISFLLAEIVLCQVDKALKVDAARAYRWYDDYEIACNSREQAELVLARLNSLLASFQLRLNPTKTKIVSLPHPAGDGWQEILRRESDHRFWTPANMVSYFDNAFRLRASYIDEPVLMYAIGTLFKVQRPSQTVLAVAESCISQAILAEPGCAQKAFALLTFWELNGSAFDRALMKATVGGLINLHEFRGISSDIAWALAFCIGHAVTLAPASGKKLSLLEDDAVALQALHASSLGLLPGFSSKAIERDLKVSSCDGEHWLLLYEAVRHGFTPALEPLVRTSTLLDDMLAKRISFYRLTVPSYAMVVKRGGAPDWIVRQWLKQTAAEIRPAPDRPQVVQLIDQDLQTLKAKQKAKGDVISALVAQFAENTADLEPDEETKQAELTEDTEEFEPDEDMDEFDPYV